MDLPDGLLLSKIIKRSTFYDRKSFDKLTSKTKPKYKLASNPILEKFFFHVLTTTLKSCKKRLTVKIKKEDWEDKIKGSYLQEDISYCDVTKYDLLEKSDLLEKMRDRKNGFIYVAKLCSAKYGKLQKLQGKMKYHYDISKETIRIVAAGLADNVDEIAEKLRLK